MKADTGSSKRTVVNERVYSCSFFVCRGNPCHFQAMDDRVSDNVLTNYEDLNVYNELVLKKWR